MWRRRDLKATMDLFDKFDPAGNYTIPGQTNEQLKGNNYENNYQDDRRSATPRHQTIRS
jgi:hypothetical protein